jgi:extradiol dioxygenase family protein
MDSPTIFHLAIPINDVALAKQFYCAGLGCKVGRENPHAVIFQFGGHQVVAHTTKEPLIAQKGIYPRHFGLVFPELSQWQNLLQMAQTQQLQFFESAKLRFPGKLTEHRTFFLQDPFYNLLEFKHYTHAEAIFGGRAVAQIGDR